MSHEEVRSSPQNAGLTRHSEGFNSSPLTRVRSVVQVHEGPPRRLLGRREAAQSAYASPVGRGPR